MAKQVILGSPLSSREKDCIALLADGLTNNQIGQALDLAAETVGSHIRNGRNKMDPHPSGRVELANAWHKMHGRDDAIKEARAAGVESAQDRLVKRDQFSERTLILLDELAKEIREGQA